MAQLKQEKKKAPDNKSQLSEWICSWDTSRGKGDEDMHSLENV